MGMVGDVTIVNDAHDRTHRKRASSTIRVARGAPKVTRSHVYALGNRAAAMVANL
jgi:hypothetical protein